MTALSNQDECIYRFDDFHLDPVKRVLLRNGEAVSLTPKRFDLLLVLVRNSGRVIDKEFQVANQLCGIFVYELEDRDQEFYCGTPWPVSLAL